MKVKSKNETRFTIEISGAEADRLASILRFGDDTFASELRIALEDEGADPYAHDFEWDDDDGVFKESK